jgi:hypothetical protein
MIPVNSRPGSRVSHHTPQEGRFSRLESGLTLVSTDALELEQLPHRSTEVTSDELDPTEDRKSTHYTREATIHTGSLHPSQSGWKGGLLRLYNAHPRIRRCYEWIRGPVPPVILQPTAKLDTASLRWRTRVIHVNLSLESRWLNYTNIFQREWLFFLLAAVYIVGLALISRTNSFMTPSESFLDCTSTYWLKDDGCGLNGQGCSPFTGPDFEFRCPGNCLSVTLANPRTVGAGQVVYETLVVGGGDSNRTYRGDSWICPAAIQA